MPILEIVEGEEIGRKYEWSAGTGIRIGRNNANDFVIPNSSVSGEHCIIEPCEGGWRIKDNGSTNGTRVNHSQRITMAMVYRNDVIAFGDITAIIRGDDVPAAEPAAAPVDSLPRTTIIIKPKSGTSTAVDGFTKKSEGKKFFNVVLIISGIAIVIAAILLVMKLNGNS